MKKDVKKAMPLYLVTDRRWLRESLIQAVEKAIQGGVTCVQLREKHLDQKHFVESARQLLSLCHQHHIPLIINDDVDVMIALDVPDEELVTRLRLRAEVSGRADDADEKVIRNRIDVYKAQTAVVADYYAEQGKYVPVNGLGAIDEIFGRLCDAVEGQGQ